MFLSVTPEMTDHDTHIVLPPGYAQAGITNQSWHSFLLNLGYLQQYNLCTVLPAAFGIRCVVYNKETAYLGNSWTEQPQGSPEH